MSVNFLKADCQQTIKEKKFGLYDAEDETPAQIMLTAEERWNATVLNEAQKTILFTAIDHCIEIVKDNGEMDSRCDDMLSYESNLLFIELKNKRGSWQSEGLSQIENTIRRMITEIPAHYYGFKKRKGIVANRKHQFPSFQNSNAEQREYFKKEYKMRLRFEAEIIIE